MFTGLIVEMGEVVSLTKRPGGARLFLSAKEIIPEAELGDSIAVNGVCLTVVAKKDGVLAFDLSEETLRSTNLGGLKAGSGVNLEPSLRMGSKLGGHFVSGHVDGVARIRSKTLTGDVFRIEIESGEEMASFLVEKGSVAVDGISLTVVDVWKDGFSIVIIPHTAAVTTIGRKGPGDSVNIEVDILGKYVSKFLNKDRDKGFMQTLVNEGFA